MIGLPFATLVLEDPPLHSARWWEYIETFLQDAGAFALLALWVWIAAMLVMSASRTGSRRRGVPVALLIVALVASVLFGLGAFGGSFFAKQTADAAAAATTPAAFQSATKGPKWLNTCHDAGGFLALLGVFVPFLLDCRNLRFRRIWALARLSFLEAMRRRVLWGFLIFLFLFLFPPKWFVVIKPEDEVRTNVELVHFGATVVLLLTAAALAAFSIPADIRNQTIHTIVTKPVEKFEIVIGRFLGYLGLTTIVMLAVFAVALILLLASHVDEDARAESMKARVPLYGQLAFRGLPGAKDYRGESVGREWEYRRYIPGDRNSPFRAIWVYFDRDLDRSLTTLPAVPCEFSFEVFKTTKGVENKALECTFFVYTWNMKHRNENTLQREELLHKEYDDRVKGLSPKASPYGTEAEKRDWAKISEIAKDMGYYEFPSKPFTSGRTESILIPTSLFEKSMEGTPPEYEKNPGPRLLVSVRCDNRTQYMGAARPDLYLLAADGSFYLNFFKGTLGLWMRLCIVIGVAVTCSTYLNGVVSFLVTAVIIGLGFLRSFIVFMAITQLVNTGFPNPGPADAMRKLINNEPLGVFPDATNPTHQVTQFADDVFRWSIRRVISFIPRLERLTWQDYVANGYNVPFDDVFWNFLGVAGYLSLWTVLGHYLIKWREIATW
jgi:ABC-type transport system involved in multi-copper enzyme maturation permease subunit